MQNRKFYILKHDLASLLALPNFAWKTGAEKEPKQFQRIRIGDRWISFAYTTSDRRERALSQITGFYECIKESCYTKIPAEALEISEGEKLAWMIEGREYREQFTDRVNVPPIDKLLGRPTLKAQTFVPITEPEFERIRQITLGMSKTEMPNSGPKQISEREARLARLATAPKVPAVITVTVEQFVRNLDVVTEVLYRAQGVCEHCAEPAPFSRVSDGSPYLEVHHTLQLAKGGEDTVENAVAICPNCHRKAHYG